MKWHCRAWDGERRGAESYVGMARSDEGVAPYGVLTKVERYDSGTVKTVPYGCIDER
ncbi:MAG: hypothetical protein RSD54_04410 [Ruthenibacterium sp.]